MKLEINKTSFNDAIKFLEKDDKKSYSIYITFQHLEKTLTDFQIDKCIDRILTKLKSDFSIEIRDK